MQKRDRGHIVLIGSVTAYFGWPSTGAYGATKAALNIMAEALRYDFDKMNIRIQVMNPGFVDTPLAAQQQLPDAGPDAGRARLSAHRPRHPLRRLRDHLPAPPHLAPEADAAPAAAPVFAFISAVTRWKARPLMPGRLPDLNPPPAPARRRKTKSVRG